MTKFGMPLAADATDKHIFAGCLSAIQPCRDTPVHGNHAEAVDFCRLIVATPFRVFIC
jgi:hypothetical protein